MPRKGDTMQNPTYRTAVREINRVTQAGKPVVAAYENTQGRIMRARQRAGHLEGRLLWNGQWVAIRSYWFPR